MIIRGLILGGTLLAATLIAPLPSQAKDDYIYGPKPDWSEYKALGEAALKAKLSNPDQWRIEWPYGYVPGRWRHKGSFYGYMSCGMLRTDTPIDERGLIQFAIVIDHGTVKIADISTRERNSLVNVWCGQLISKGFLPPAGQFEPRELAITKLGLTIRPMPEGAYVVSAADEMPARAAGIRSGTVLIRANGISLAGMGLAMGKLLEGDAALWTFETATGESVQVRQAP